MTKRRLAPLMVAGLLSLTGCITGGKYFVSDTKWLHKGTTEQKDVSLVLGEPTSVGDSGGTSTWTYTYYTYGPIEGFFRKELKIYWDDSKKIQNYQFDSSFPQDKKLGPVK